MRDFEKYAQQAGISLTEEQMEKFALYEELLLEWNQKMNLTSITDPDEVKKKHFIDSLLVLQKDWIPEGTSLIDVGSGAGFPGIPIVIARPDLSITFADSLKKRLGFLEEVIGKLDIKQTKLVHGRAEDLGRNPAYREQYDIAVARAVASLPVLLEYTLPFVKVGGQLIAWKGPKAQEELDDSARALGQLGGKHRETNRIDLFDMQRALVRIQKAKPTPQAYPRQPKRIQDKPL